MVVPGGSKGLNKRIGRFLAALLLAGAGSSVAAEEPGQFDYWVLSLSWSPQFCKTQPAAEQCKQPRGMVVHGLWPQNERGYPDYCGERERVDRELIDRMLPLIPDPKLIQQQWRKHGSCSGLPIGEYFLNVERAWRSIVLPPSLGVDAPALESSAREIEESLIEANPKLDHDSMALLCKGRWLSEIRLCLDKDFQPRACGDDVQDRCKGEVNIRPNRYRKPQ
ncbi:MAG TPA: ribonuclease T2 [Fontimonas sp.]